MEKINLIVQGSCNNYTCEIIQHYLHLDFVDKIIVSCWKNDVLPNAHDRIIVIQSDDLPNPGHGNRNRQIKTSLVGLQNSTAKFSVKLRSDQKISHDSMKLMYDFYERHQEQELSFFDGSKPRNRICVAGIFRPFPFHPRDHIFWGNTQDLIDVFSIPYDNTSTNDDYTKFLRSEAYICMWYYAKFDPEVAKFVNEPAKYLVDRAPCLNEALVKSNYWGAKIFKPFPKIDFAWPKYGLSNYHYDHTASVYGEYWDN